MHACMHACMCGVLGSGVHRTKGKIFGHGLLFRPSEDPADEGPACSSIWEFKQRKSGVEGPLHRLSMLLVGSHTVSSPHGSPSRATIEPPGTRNSKGRTFNAAQQIRTGTPKFAIELSAKVLMVVEISRQDPRKQKTTVLP